MSRLRLGLAGHPDRQKKSAGKYLAQNHGFKVFDPGEFLRAEAEKENTALESIKDFANFQYHLRRIRSATFLADYVLSLAEDKVAFVGLRNRLDAMALKKAGGLIIALATPEDMLEESLRPNLNGSTAQKDDMDSFESHVDFIIHRSDYLVDISGGQQATLDQLDIFLSAQKDESEIQK